MGAAGSSRCIVLVPGEAPVPPGLLAALRQRRVEVAIARDAAAVMVELATRPATAVIAVEPGSVRHLLELERAVQRYYAQTGLWTYRPGTGQGPRLERLSLARPAPAARPATSPATAAAAPANGYAAAGAGDPGEQEPLISAAEMEMLLANDRPGASR